MTSRQRPELRPLALLLVLLPVAGLAWAVWRLGVNTAIADELHYVPFIRLLREGGDWQAWIWQQHNEHRVVTLKLLMAVLQGPTHWNQRAEMFCSVALTVVLVCVLWRIHREQGADQGAAGLLLFAPLAWLACSLAQYENQFYGLMVCHYVTAVGGVVALWALGRSKPGWQLLAVLAAVVASTSVASGLLVFPIGLAILAAQRAHWGRWLLWGASGAATYVLYFRQYLEPPHGGPIQWTVDGLLLVGRQGLLTLGSPLGAHRPSWSLALGVAMALLSIGLLARWLRGGAAQRAREAPAAALLLLGLATCAMVGLGRAFMVTPGDPLQSRYTTHANLAWFGGYLLLTAQRSTSRLAILHSAFSALLVGGLLAANAEGYAAALRWRQSRLLDQYVSQTVAVQPDSVLARMGDPEWLRPRLEYLRSERLSAYREPVQMLLAMDLGQHVGLADIRQDQVVRQRFTCSVHELHDLGVFLLPAVRPGPLPLHIALHSGEEQLLRVAVDAASITAFTWFEVPLQRPFLCAGRELLLTLESATVTPGEQVAALAVPSYYPGRLAQGDVEIPDRNLALALNGFHFGLVAAAPPAN